MKTMILVLASLLIASGAFAQSVVLTNYVDITPLDDTSGLSSGGVSITLGMQFDHVVIMNNAAGDFNAWEFSTIALDVVVPGVFNLRTRWYGSQLSLGDVPGEYIVGVGFCSPTTPVELLRVKYAAFGGTPSFDTVVELWGTEPSSFGGEPGIALCTGELVVAVQGGTDGGITCQGVEFPDGGLIINPWWGICPIEEESMSQLKARF